MIAQAWNGKDEALCWTQLLVDAIFIGQREREGGHSHDRRCRAVLERFQYSRRKRQSDCPDRCGAFDNRRSKLTAFLPAKYYFSFSQFVNSPNNTTPFLISTPAYVTEQKLWVLIANDKRLKILKCDKGNEPAEQPAPDEATQAKEVQLLNEDIKASLQPGDFATNLIGLAIRLCIPLLAGFFVGRLFGPGGQLAAPFGAAAGALLLCWPVIVLWDLVVADPFKGQYGQFLLLYILYCVLFYYMARIGVTLGSQTTQISGPRINLSKIIESSAGAIVAAVGTQFVQHLILKQ